MAKITEDEAFIQQQLKLYFGLITHPEAAELMRRAMEHARGQSKSN